MQAVKERRTVKRKRQLLKHKGVFIHVYSGDISKEYDSGVKVPEYASIFWIDSKQPWTPGYLEDASALNRVARDGTEGLTITHRVGTRYEAEEHMTVVVPALNPSETLNVRYS